MLLLRDTEEPISVRIKHTQEVDVMKFLHFKVCWSTSGNKFRNKNFPTIMYGSNFTAARKNINFLYFLQILLKA